MRLFTVAGYEYAAPDAIGRGYDIVRSENIFKLFRKTYPVLEDEKDENGTILWAESRFGTTTKTFLETYTRWFDSLERADLDTLTYAAFLKPVANAPAIDKLWYMSALPEELQAIDSYIAKLREASDAAMEFLKLVSVHETAEMNNADVARESGVDYDSYCPVEFRERYRLLISIEFNLTDYLTIINAEASTDVLDVYFWLKNAYGIACLMDQKLKNNQS